MTCRLSRATQQVSGLRRSASLVVAGFAVIAASVATASVGWAAEPTIRFTSTGQPPAVCGSAPSVPRQSVQVGSRVILINELGVDANLEIRGSKTIAVADGDGVALRLRPGEHAIRLRPKCEDVTTVTPVIVTVLQPDEVTQRPTTPGSGATPREPVRPTKDQRSSTPVPTSPGATASGSGGGSPAPSFVLGGAGESPDRGDLAGEEVGLDDPIYAAEIIPGSRPDYRARKLLAVTAAICVLGVMSAIVRVILAQRTSRVLGAT